MALYDPFLAISDIFDADVLYTEGPGGPGPRGELSGAAETAKAACQGTSAELCQVLTRHCNARQSPWARSQGTPPGRAGGRHKAPRRRQIPADIIEVAALQHAAHIERLCH